MPNAHMGSNVGASVSSSKRFVHIATKKMLFLSIKVDGGARVLESSKEAGKGAGGKSDGVTA